MRLHHPTQFQFRGLRWVESTVQTGQLRWLGVGGCGEEGRVRLGAV